ncbi:hypothetical protein A2J03_06550 [Rhodococcus sp. EPR-157]|nr:hypothetical protein A2J03_06550 [Rhodococcus sp. EPR-157]
MLGDIEVQKLTKADIDRLVKRLRAGEQAGYKKWSPRSVNYMLSIFTAVVESQQRQGHVERNVARLVEHLPSEKAEMKILSEEDMFKILDHPGRDRHLWALALYGLRRGEIAALRWEHVNFETKTVRVTENRVVSGRVITTGTPKSRRSRRILPMPDEVLDALREAHALQLQERFASASYADSDYIACDSDGRPYHPNLLTFRWRKLLRELSIDRVRLHDARHSCGSLMHMRNVPTVVIAAWLGHSSAAFTMATYIHSQDDALLVASTSYQRGVTIPVTTSVGDNVPKDK